MLKKIIILMMSVMLVTTSFALPIDETGLVKVNRKGSNTTDRKSVV